MSTGAGPSTASGPPIGPPRGAEPATTRARRPDASMALLQEIERHPLDPGYAEAAARRAEGQPPKRRQLVTLVLSAAVAAITVAAVLALRSPQPDADTYNMKLKERVESLTDAVQVAERRNAATRTEIAEAEGKVLDAPI